MKTSIFIRILLVLGLCISFADAGWFYLNSGTTVTLRGVCFTDIGTGIGYVVGDSGVILKTTNHGDDWIPLNSGISSRLNAVCIAKDDFNTIYAVGDNGIILKTTNAGTNWALINLGLSDNLMDISYEYHPDVTVYIVADTNRITKYSVTGGWEQQWVTSGLKLYGTTTNRDGFTTEVCGYRSGNSTGYVLKTTNGGSNWLENTVTDTKWYSIIEARSNVWWVGGATVSSQQARVAVTEDSGHIYTTIYQGETPSTVYGVSTTGQDYCFACGDSFIIRFNNMGQNYITQLNSCPILYDIHASSRNYIWAVGENGTILRTTDGGGGGVIVVLSPNGGEYWERGNNYDITWLSDNVPGNLMIELYKGGVSYDTIVNNTPNTGQYNYTVPLFLPHADDYQVKITSLDNLQVFDLSDDYFMIGSGVNITVTYPNGDEFLKTMDTCYITWESNGIPGNVRIWLYLDDIPYEYIDYGTSNSGLYPWYIPSHQPRDTTYKIRIQSIEYPTVDDYSNDYFIIGKQIAIIQPTAGDTLYGGQSYDILWDSSGVGGNVCILYSTDGGWEWDTVIPGTPDGGSYIWTVPNTPTDIGRILIKHLSYNNTNNTQSDIFTIVITSKPWTIFVFMNGDNSLESAAIGDVNEMERGVDTLFNVIIELDRIPGGYAWQDDTSNGNWTTTRDYYISYDPNSDDVIRSQLLCDLGELDMGNPTTVSNFVTRYINEYPAEHYLIILWDHGNGWYYRNLNDDPLFKGISWDVTDTSSIGVANHEYHSALQSIHSYLGRSIDILAHDACLMGMQELAYEAKDFVNIIVFSEHTEPGNGYPYTDILGYLHSNPNATVQELAHNIVTKYIQSYMPGGSQYQMSYSVTQSAISSGTSFQHLTQRIDTFALELMNAGGLYQSDIYSARYYSQEYARPHHIDLYDFAQRIMSTTALPVSLRASADSIMNAISEIMIAEGHYTVSGGINVDSSHGLAIYYPTDTSEVDSTYPWLYFTSDYPNWMNFLNGDVISINEKPVSGVPHKFSISFNPNPLSIDAIFQYDLPKTSYITIEVFDISGRSVKTLINGRINAGCHRLTWNGSTDDGTKLPSGIYFICFVAEEHQDIKKLLIIR